MVLRDLGCVCILLSGVLSGADTRYGCLGVWGFGALEESWWYEMLFNAVLFDCNNL